MAQSVFKTFRLRFKEPWFMLSKEEQDALLGKLGEALTKVGGKGVLMCESAWASEQWWFWGVEEYPSVEAIQEHTRLLTELNWMRYCDSETLLGTAMTE
jgi:hypothetical protein